MKIFLSWSGEVSHRVARALESWIPCVLQGIETFISSDISKGDRWNDVLVARLKEAQYGIICVTPYNIHKSWMNFEAGALSNALSRSSVVMPFLFRVKPDDLDGPLSQFQSTVYEKEDVRSMIHSLNRHLEKPLPADQLDHTFDKWWGDLSEDLDKIPATTREETRAYYEWLYTREDLEINNLANYNSAWIVTNEAERYLRQSVKMQLTEAFRAGKAFRYFLPRSDEYEYHAELERLAKEHPKHFSFKLFPVDEFESQVATDYIILDPDGGELRAFVKIPLGNHDQQEYWFRATDRSARSFVSRFRKLWDHPRKLEATAAGSPGA